MSNNPLSITSLYTHISEDLLAMEEKLRSLADTSLMTGPLKSLVDHITTSEGKRLRPALTLLSSRFSACDSTKPILMATAVELLHMATLIHDDTVDNSTLRRGKATVDNLWGKNAAVLIGDYLFATSATFVCDTENIHVIKRFSQTISELSLGELAELFSAFEINQTMTDYETRIYNKTASLFYTSTQSGAILSGADTTTITALSNYGLNIGMAFQILDDILDYEGTTEEFGKPVGNDLLQGTVTLPVLLMAKHYPRSVKKLELFDEVGRPERIAEFVESIKDSSVLDESYSVAWNYIDKALADISKLPAQKERQDLEDLANYLKQRKFK